MLKNKIIIYLKKVLGEPAGFASASQPKHFGLAQPRTGCPSGKLSKLNGTAAGPQNEAVHV